MKCKTAACEDPPAYRSRYCEKCLPVVEEQRRQKKLAWWRAYYRKVIRVRRGHKKQYKVAGTSP